MRFLSCIVAILGIFFSYHALATSCRHSTCMEYLIRHDLVFKGKALSSGATTPEMQEEFNKKRNPESKGGGLPNTYTDFEVIALYKGVSDKKARVYYSSHRKGMIAGDIDVNAYPDGQEVTVYATRTGGFHVVYRGLCSGCGGEEKLSAIKAQYDAMDQLIQKYPKVLEFYAKKISLYEEHRDFDAAAAAYDLAFANVPGAKDSVELKARYGRMLQLSGQAEKAISVLQNVKGVSSATTDLQLSLLKLGRNAELSGQQLAMAGQELSNLTLKDADLAGSDFTGAKLNNVKFVNVNLQGAIFTNAQMSIEINSSKLGEAKFSGAKIRGSILDSNFDKASFANAEIDLRVANRNSFKEADFSSAKVYISECTAQPKDWEGNDFTNARFREATFGGLHKSKIAGADLSGMKFHTNRCRPQNQGVDLSGRKLDGTLFDHGDYSGASFKGASLKAASFSGTTLTDVDFQDADLTDAAFTIASYSGPVKLEGANFTNAKLDGAKWAGAIFDCKTKFPKSFDPIAHNLEPADRSCITSKPVGVVDYSRERLMQGYINVCDGDYRADCAYGFLLAAAFNHLNSNNSGATPLRVAQSLLDAGEPELARLLTLRTMAQLPDAQRQYFLGRNKEALLMLAQIYRAKKDAKTAAEMLALGEMANQRKYVNDHPAFQPDYQLKLVDEWIASGDLDGAEKAFIDYFQNNPYLKYGGYTQDGVKMLSHISEAYARAGNFEKAISLGKKIGSKEMLTGIPLTEPRLETATKTFEESYQKAYQDAITFRSYRIETRQYLAAITQLALIRYAKGERDFLKDYLEQADKLSQKIPENHPGIPPRPAPPFKRDHRETAALEVLSGIPLNDIATSLEGNAANLMHIPGVPNALAATGNIEPIWSAFMKPVEQPERKVGLLVPLAEYYAVHPDKDGLERIRKGLEALTVDRLPTQSDVILVGREFRAHKTIFDMLVKIKSIEGIQNVIKRSEGYKIPALKAYVALYAAEAAARLNDEEKAWQWFDQFRPVYEEQLSQQKGQRHFTSAEEDITDFALAMAASNASQASKNKAIDIVNALVGRPRAGSLIPLKLAIARKTSKAATDTEIQMALVGPMLDNVNVLISAIEILRDNGLKDEVKPLLPTAVVRVEYSDARFAANSLQRLVRILAQEGDIEGAERLARTTFDSRARKRVGDGARADDFDVRQQVLKKIAFIAAERQNTDVALAILKDIGDDPGTRSTVFFALAKSALKLSDRQTAEKFYGMGRDAAPDLFSIMAAPLARDPGEQVEDLVLRASVEHGLGKTDAFRRTSDFLRAMLPIIERKHEQAAVAHAAIRTLKDISGDEENKTAASLDAVRTQFPNPDFNTTTQLRGIALNLLENGRKGEAREVVLWGLKGVSSFPASDSKASLLLRYADIIAKTGTSLSDENRRQLEKMIRTTPFTRHGQPEASPPTKDVDYVAVGEEIFGALRSEKDNPPPIDGRR